MSFYHRTLKCQHKTVKNLHHSHQKWHLELSFYISFIFEKIKGTYKDAWFHLKLLIKTWWSPKHDLASLVVAEPDGPVAVPDGFGINSLGHPVGPPGPPRRVVLEVAGLNRLSLAAVAPLIAPFKGQRNMVKYSSNLRWAGHGQQKQKRWEFCFSKDLFKRACIRMRKSSTKC